MKFDGKNNVKGLRAIVPDAQGVGAVNGTGIDCRGFDELQVALDVGAIGAGSTVDFKLQESSDDGVADAYADITGLSITQIVAANKSALLNVDLSQRERYIRAVCTVGVNAVDLAAWASLMRYKYPPVTQTANEVLDKR